MMKKTASFIREEASPVGGRTGKMSGGRQKTHD
jgi:hypothetical protein